MSGFKISVACPYCGFQNRTTVAGNVYTEINIVYCDVDEGGCDGIFAVRATLRIDAEGLPIKGCEPRPSPEPDDGPAAGDPAAFLAAAEIILKRFDEVAAEMPNLIDRDGERFAGGYLEGIGQAAGLLRHLVEAAKKGGAA